MVYRPAYVYTGSDWDTVGDPRFSTLPLSVKTADFTLALTDQGSVLLCESASPIVVTIPADLSVAFTNGARVDIVQYGAGAVSVAAASGVVFHSLDSGSQLSGQYAVASLVKTGVDTWLLVGNVVAP